MNVNITDITILANPKSQSQLFLEVPSFQFFKMLTHACIEVLSVCVPVTERSLDPKQGVPECFSTQTDQVRALMMGYDLPHFYDQITYLAFHSQVSFILSYVEYRNEDRDKYYVGMEPYTDAMVYAAIVAFHNWKAKALEAQINRDGPLFGSATGWFTMNHAELVKDWPERYKFAARAIDQLPCERSDYQQRCEEYRILQDLPKATGYVRLKDGRVVKIWSNNVEDKDLNVHEYGNNFDAEAHFTFVVPYSDVEELNVQDGHLHSKV